MTDKKEQIAALEQDLTAATLAGSFVKQFTIKNKIAALNRPYSDSDILKAQLRIKMNLQEN